MSDLPQAPVSWLQPKTTAVAMSTGSVPLPTATPANKTTAGSEIANVRRRRAIGGSDGADLACETAALTFNTAPHSRLC